jgi:arginyl-tRNA synthetase
MIPKNGYILYEVIISIGLIAVALPVVLTVWMSYAQLLNTSYTQLNQLRESIYLSQVLKETLKKSSVIVPSGDAPLSTIADAPIEYGVKTNRFYIKKNTNTSYLTSDIPMQSAHWQWEAPHLLKLTLNHTTQMMIWTPNE